MGKLITILNNYMADLCLNFHIWKGNVYMHKKHLFLRNDRFVFLWPGTLKFCFNQCKKKAWERGEWRAVFTGYRQRIKMLKDVLIFIPPSVWSSMQAFKLFIGSLKRFTVNAYIMFMYKLRLVSFCCVKSLVYCSV